MADGGAYSSVTGTRMPPSPLQALAGSSAPLPKQIEGRKTPPVYQRIVGEASADPLVPASMIPRSEAQARIVGAGNDLVNALADLARTASAGSATILGQPVSPTQIQSVGRTTDSIAELSGVPSLHRAYQAAQQGDMQGMLLNYAMAALPFMGVEGARSSGLGARAAETAAAETLPQWTPAYRGLRSEWSPNATPPEHSEFWTANPHLASSYASESFPNPDALNVVPGEVNTGNFLHVNADGGRWDNIPISGIEDPRIRNLFPNVNSSKGAMVHQLTNYAQDHGYDGVAFHNLSDHPFDATDPAVRAPSTVFSVLNRDARRSAFGTPLDAPALPPAIDIPSAPAPDAGAGGHEPFGGFEPAQDVAGGDMRRFSERVSGMLNRGEFTEADVPLNTLTATQRNTRPDLALAAEPNQNTATPIIVRSGGRDYIYDGHFRLATQAARDGATSARVRLIDLDGKGRTPSAPDGSSVERIPTDAPPNGGGAQLPPFNPDSPDVLDITSNPRGTRQRATEYPFPTEPGVRGQHGLEIGGDAKWKGEPFGSVPTFRAALRDPTTGEIYVGANHAEALDSAPEAIQSRLESEWHRGSDHSGFVTRDGQFLTRDEALSRLGALSDVPEQGLRTGTNEVSMPNRTGKGAPFQPHPLKAQVEQAIRDGARNTIEIRRILGVHHRALQNETIDRIAQNLGVTIEHGATGRQASAGRAGLERMLLEGGHTMEELTQASGLSRPHIDRISQDIGGSWNKLDRYAELQSRNARILELVQEMQPTRNQAVGTGRKLGNSYGAIAQRMHDEGFEGLNHSIIAGVVKRNADAIARGDVSPVIPDAAPNIAAELNIPESHVRAISAARKSDGAPTLGSEPRRTDLPTTVYHATTNSIEGPLRGEGSLGQGAYSSRSPEIANALLADEHGVFPEGANIVPERVPSLADYVPLSKAEDDMFNTALRRGINLDDPNAVIKLQNDLIGHYQRKGYVGIHDPDYANGLGQLVTWDGKNRRAPWARMMESARGSSDPFAALAVSLTPPALGAAALASAQDAHAEEKPSDKAKGSHPSFVEYAQHPDQYPQVAQHPRPGQEAHYPSYVAPRRGDHGSFWDFPMSPSAIGSDPATNEPPKPAPHVKFSEVSGQNPAPFGDDFAAWLAANTPPPPIHTETVAKPFSAGVLLVHPTATPVGSRGGLTYEADGSGPSATSHPITLPPLNVATDSNGDYIPPDTHISWAEARRRAEMPRMQAEHIRAQHQRTAEAIMSLLFGNHATQSNTGHGKH